MDTSAAIMQPYIFPYLGYFQLIQAADHFVFYDDVSFIKKGWINRNQLLINKEAKKFSVPLIKASQNKLIKEVEVCNDPKWFKQFFTTLEHSYKAAPYYGEVIELIKDIFEKDFVTISDLAIISVQTISDHLGIDVTFSLSSEEFSESRGINRAERLATITKECGAEVYINPQGGMELYSKEMFIRYGVDLRFIVSDLPAYKQYENDFVKGLSIIDILMFNSRNEVKKMLDLYELK
ncbi:WbqC family protein [Parvicella tangerina]|uniref:WbqC family protein n=1 Tax=Parvicella tangerina TaxID=2829795 RepID=A0A916JLW2_9FLAO|nr:WbqC family protein [Parvicella tangerina]CAG5079703.1 hypothetical protein CRYO30217_01024 [Parvicella tangerina]